MGLPTLLLLLLSLCSTLRNSLHHTRNRRLFLLLLHLLLLLLLQARHTPRQPTQYLNQPTNLRTLIRGVLQRCAALRVVGFEGQSCARGRLVGCWFGGGGGAEWCGGLLSCIGWRRGGWWDGVFACY